MKTIRQWLEELPDPYRTQALENIRVKEVLDLPELSFSVALRSAFTWDATPQGYDYWSAVLANPPKKLPAITPAQQECINGQNSEDNRELPCPECEDGELYQVGYTQPNGTENFECDKCGYTISFP